MVWTKGTNSGQIVKLEEGERSGKREPTMGV